jgi:uncharacterized protein (DUF1501 family)
MLNLITPGSMQDCGGVSRRGCLQVGTLALGGLTLPQLLAARAQAAQIGRGAKDVSVVLLFLTGGPSQVETFDPKMTAPQESRSATGEVATDVPGVTFGGTFPMLARHASRMAIVRSFTHGNSDHTGAAEDVMRCGNTFDAGMGSLVTRFRGATHPQTGMPNHLYLAIDDPDPQFDKERLRLRAAAAAGSLGGSFDPLDIGTSRGLTRNLKLNVPAARLHERRSLRKSLDRLRRDVDSGPSLSRFEQQAVDIVLGRSRDAFDLSQEDPKLVERYDTGRFNTALRVETRYSTLGRQMLLARRLCEAGCGFVTVHNPGWDMHGGPTQFNMPNGMERLGRPVDKAVSAFLEDVQERGLSDRILLIITGEFGRTPKVKPDGGRDHWPRLSTLAFAGGGLKMGQIIGKSDSRAGEPQSRPVTLDQLLGTVLHTTLDVPAIRSHPGISRELLSTFDRVEPIRELTG